MPPITINSPLPLKFYPIHSLNPQRPKKTPTKRHSPKKNAVIDSPPETSLFSDYSQLTPVDGQTDKPFVDAVLQLYQKQKSLSERYRDLVKIQDSIVEEFADLLNKWDPAEINLGMISLSSTVKIRYYVMYPPPRPKDAVNRGKPSEGGASGC